MTAPVNGNIYSKSCEFKGSPYGTILSQALFTGKVQRLSIYRVHCKPMTVEAQDNLRVDDIV